jgi:hypothetical protein
MPLSFGNNASASPLLWVDKLKDPCNIGASGAPVSYTVCLEPTNPSSATGGTDCFTVPVGDKSMSCSSVQEQVCVSGANVSNYSSWGAMPYVVSSFAACSGVTRVAVYTDIGRDHCAAGDARPDTVVLTIFLRVVDHVVFSLPST